MELFDFGVPVDVVAPTVRLRSPRPRHTGRRRISATRSRRRRRCTPTTGVYSVDLAQLKQIEPTLDWGGKLTVGVGPSGRDADQVVCLSEAADGVTYALGDVAPGRRAGTYYGRKGARGVERGHRVGARLALVARGSSFRASWDRRVRLDPWKAWFRRSVGVSCTSTTASIASGPSATPARASTSATRSRRSRPTVTRPSRWRCSGTRPTSASSRSAPTSRGCSASRTSCSPRRSSPCTRTSRSPSSRSTARPRTRSATRLDARGRPRRRRARRAPRGVARAHRALPRATASTRSLPMKQVCCFYPMSKRRAADANWYELPFDDRKELMAGHARVGRTYAGRVLAAHHRLDRHRRLGVGRHAARRRHRRAEGDRVRDALRPGVGALRRVRPVLHRPRARPGRRVRAGRAARRGRRR